MAEPEQERLAVSMAVYQLSQSLHGGIGQRRQYGDDAVQQRLVHGRRNAFGRLCVVNDGTRYGKI